MQQYATYAQTRACRQVMIIELAEFMEIADEKTISVIFHFSLIVKK
jgi:hypothetical protein